MEFGEKVRAERVRRGWSQQELADRVGTTQSTIDRIERGESSRSRLAPAISAILEIAVPVPGKPNHLIMYRDGAVAAESEKRQALEIYSVGGESDGDFNMVKLLTDVEERISSLRDVKNAFGLGILTYDMEPSYEPGDVAFVNPNLPPVRNCDVVVAQAGVSADVHSASPAIITHRVTLARLLSWDDGVWRLRYWNLGGRGVSDRTVLRAEWPHAWRIVGKRNRI